MAHLEHQAEYYRLRGELERALALGARCESERLTHLEAASRFAGMAQSMLPKNGDCPR